MNIAALAWFTIGACLVYAVAVDENVFIWLVLVSKTASIWLQRQWFRIRYHPDSPWVRWQIERNANGRGVPQRVQTQTRARRWTW
jgi:hypothetical protein